MIQVMKPQCATTPEVRTLEGRDRDDERCNVMYVTKHDFLIDLCLRFLIVNDHALIFHHLSSLPLLIMQRGASIRSNALNQESRC